MRRWARFTLAIAVIAAVVWCRPYPAYAATTIDSVRSMITANLSEDPTVYASYSEAECATVKTIEEAYESLSADDRATLDVETGKGFSQPYGRVLETAVWSLRSLEVPDNTTTLDNGVYDADSEPALSSQYSKGKSTSPRDRPWRVESVTVVEGKAYATITVESSTYPAMITGGVKYGQANASGNSRFENVPIDLNSTFYFAGVSSSMPRPIAFALTTTIDEPDSRTVQLEATSQLKTFSVSEATLVLKQTGSSSKGNEKERALLYLTMGDKMYDRVAYKFETEGSLSEVEAALGKDGAFEIALNSTDDMASFTSGTPITMRFHTSLSDSWIERQVTIDVNRATLVVAGDEIDSETVQKMIESLTYDPWRVTTQDAESVALVEKAYEALSDADQVNLDNLKYRTQTYGRALQQANWALEALEAVDSTTLLSDGTYTGKVAFESSMGKSLSARAKKFLVEKVIVKDSQATARLRYEGTSADMVLTGGRVYRHVNSDEDAPSQFEVPIKLNEPLYVIMLAKNPVASTVGITYMVTTSVDEYSTSPDDESEAGNRGDSGGNGGGNGGSSSATGGNGDDSGNGGAASGSGGNGSDNGSGNGSGDEAGENAAGGTGGGKAGEKDSGAGSGKQESGEDGDGKSDDKESDDASSKNPNEDNADGSGGRKGNDDDKNDSAGKGANQNDGVKDKGKSEGGAGKDGGAGKGDNVRGDSGSGGTSDSDNGKKDGASGNGEESNSDGNGDTESDAGGSPDVGGGDNDKANSGEGSGDSNSESGTAGSKTPDSSTDADLASNRSSAHAGAVKAGRTVSTQPNFMSEASNHLSMNQPRLFAQSQLSSSSAGVASKAPSGEAKPTVASGQRTGEASPVQSTTQAQDVDDEDEAEATLSVESVFALAVLLVVCPLVLLVSGAAGFVLWFAHREIGVGSLPARKTGR